MYVYSCMLSMVMFRPLRKKDMLGFNLGVWGIRSDAHWKGKKLALNVKK